MVTYGDKNIIEIIEKNLEKNGEDVSAPVVGVGLQVVTHPKGSKKPYFYEYCFRPLLKHELDGFVYPERDNTDEKVMRRYEIATKANGRMLMDELKTKTNEDKFIEVLENDRYTKKLISIDIIEEAFVFIFDPNTEEFAKWYE